MATAAGPQPAQPVKPNQPTIPDQPPFPERPIPPERPPHPERPLKERQREEREHLILQTAEDLLLERGYHEMSIDEVAARVGISKGTVYLHFPSKEDLVVALLERGTRQFIRALDDVLSAPGTPREKLRAIIGKIYWGTPGRRFDLRTILFQNPELLRRMAERRHAEPGPWDESTRRIGTLLDEGKASGDFDPSMSTAVMMSQFWSMINPHSYQRLVVQEGMPIEEVVEQLTRFYFKGIAANSSCDPEIATPPDAKADTRGTRDTPPTGEEEL